MEAKIHPQ
jgi:hypothetical protein